MVEIYWGYVAGVLAPKLAGAEWEPLDRSTFYAGWPLLTK